VLAKVPKDDIAEEGVLRSRGTSLRGSYQRAFIVDHTYTSVVAPWSRLRSSAPHDQSDYECEEDGIAAIVVRIMGRTWMDYKLGSEKTFWVGT